MRMLPNRRAYLARYLTRDAFNSLRWERPVIYGALVLLWITSAIYGTWLRHDAAVRSNSLFGLIFDLLYAPFTYIVPQPNFAFAHKLLWPEAIARIVGPLIPLVSILWLSRRRLLIGLADLFIRQGAKGFSLIVGNCGSADALAISSSEGGEPVVLVDLALQNDENRQMQLGKAGVIVLRAIPHDLGRVGTIVVWQESDADNIASAVALRNKIKNREAEIHLAVRSPELHHALLQAPDLMLDRTVRLRPHSPARTAVRETFAAPDLLELAVAHGQSAVTLCLWGNSDALHWIAETALQQLWSVQLGPPRILWVHERSIDAAPDAFTHFLAHIDLTFDAKQRPEIVWVKPEDAWTDQTVTCHIVDADEDDTTVATAFALAACLRQIVATPAPVRTVLNNDRTIEHLFLTGALSFLPPILPGIGLAIEALRDRRADEAAAAIHIAYDRAFGNAKTAPASGQWQDLPETYVAANRAAADHISVKRWDFANSGLSNDALIEALARAEHNRWCAERLLDGWAPAGESARDNARRLHPDLRPWMELNEDARNKDRNAVREALDGSH